MECVFCSHIQHSVLTFFLELIKSTFPWLWEMKDLISERPNITPVGLGNSESTIDMSIYDTGYKLDTFDSKPVTEDDDDMPDDDDDDADDADDADDMISIRRKRSSNKRDKATPAQKARSLKSETPGDRKKFKALDRFADLASAEEATNQKELDLKRLRSRNTFAKIRAKADIQIQRDKLKAEMRMLEKTQEHNFRMAQLNLQITKAGTSGSLPTDFYNASLHPSQSGATGLFNTADASQSTRSFSTGPSSAFDLDSFDYNTPLSSSAPLPPLPLPENLDS